MKITLLQTSLVWEDRDANLAGFEREITGLDEPGDVIVLPEMFTTGFSMDAQKVAEPEGRRALACMKGWSASTGAVVIGSVSVASRGKYYNRLFVAFPDGKHVTYDKRYLFSMAGEHEHYTAGIERCTFSWKGWRICPLVCYDLRFPEWSRNVPLSAGEAGPPVYDLLVYCANWPSARATAWHHLLIARAIENQCYVAGVNRTGSDGNGILYDGGSLIVDPKGEVLASGSTAPAILEAELKKDELESFRQKFPVLKDVVDLS